MSTVPPRKRASRACDRCSDARTRCDGQFPCHRCQEYNHPCQYNRDIKKRGRKRSSNKAVPGLEKRAPYSPSILIRDPYTGGSAAGNRHDAARPGQDSPGTPSDRMQSASRPGYFSASSTGASEYTPAIGEAHSAANPERPSALLERSGGPSGSSLRLGDYSPRSERNPKHLHVSTVIPSPWAPQPRAPAESSFRPPGPQICRYSCLNRVMPMLQDIMDPESACDLLELYFAEPDGSLFESPSPYVLSPIIRKQSLLRPVNPRNTTPALLITMLWVSAQTAEVSILLRPGMRNGICERLKALVISLLRDRDPDNTQDSLVGFSRNQPGYHAPGIERQELLVDTSSQSSYRSIDDVITFILLTIVISGGDLKKNSLMWWGKAVRRAQDLGLNHLDHVSHDSSDDTYASAYVYRSHVPDQAKSIVDIEAEEEGRRTFWLLFALDRHLALSFNGNLFLSDDECQIYTPLPDRVWEHLEVYAVSQLPQRTYGPPTRVTGTGFLEYFLPLMTILGDVIQLHHRRNHPRFGALAHDGSIALIEDQLAVCIQSVHDLTAKVGLRDTDMANSGSLGSGSPLSPAAQNGSSYNQHHLPSPSSMPPHASEATTRHRKVLLVSLYARFILHVIQVLLHGKWDALSMLSHQSPHESADTDRMDISNWITSVSFMKCASNAIMGSEVVSEILVADPELTFMPYLFGIYLLHGSFIILLFADRMPEVDGGPNESVEKACETIIRAHEVCVVTLSTEFQRRFRKVLRATIYRVRSQKSHATAPSVASLLATPVDQHGPDGGAGESRWNRDGAEGGANASDIDMRKKVLSLYRWTSGSRGLAV